MNTYTSERAKSQNAAVNMKKGYTVRMNNGKVISRHTDAEEAKTAMRNYGITRCYISFYLMRPIDYRYNLYTQLRALGMTASEAGRMLICK